MNASRELGVFARKNASRLHSKTYPLPRNRAWIKSKHRHTNVHMNNVGGFRARTYCGRNPPPHPSAPSRSSTLLRIYFIMYSRQSRCRLRITSVDGSLFVGICLTVLIATPPHTEVGEICVWIIPLSVEYLEYLTSAGDMADWASKPSRVDGDDT